MQVFHYGFWDEWLNPQKVTFDGPNKLMLVNQGVTEIDVEVDLYSDWKEWAKLYDHGKFLPAMRTVGGDPTTGGRALGATFFLTNGWRIRTWDGDHRLTVTGNLYTEEGEPPFIPVTGPYTTIIESNVSNLVDRLSRLDDLADQEWSEAQHEQTRVAFADLAASLPEGEFPTVLEIAQEVWAAPEGQRIDLAAKILRNRTVTDPITGQMIVYDDDGVTPLLAATLFEDANETQPYRGQGAEVRGRLEQAP